MTMVWFAYILPLPRDHISIGSTFGASGHLPHASPAISVSAATGTLRFRSAAVRTHPVACLLALSPLLLCQPTALSS
ncbi:hypothetical protein K439DRAFT_378546 [Ramaria rubella]|nr:hypothetical protein K439DRAFT_378546 [Ramaria rubella]